MAVKRSMDTYVGIVNRRNYSIVVNLKDDSFFVSAGGRTEKNYREKDIVSVEGMSLQQAIASGMCHIVR